MREGFRDESQARLKIQEEGFANIAQSISDGLSEIAKVVEWGLEEIKWSIEEQTIVLREIDKTLKTPGETQANEWRRHGEELRRRGVLDESEEFFLKALELNRLDFRIYAGLAQTYLQGNRFNEAYTYLEKSLPHAPVSSGIDYKSYSLRLIGRIYECAEDYSSAAFKLREAVALSPKYPSAQYSYSQYCARTGDIKNALKSLEFAIGLRPQYWYIADREENFSSCNHEVSSLLSRLFSSATEERRMLVRDSQSAIRSASSAYSNSLKLHSRLSNSESEKESIGARLKEQIRLLQDLEKLMQTNSEESNDYSSILCRSRELRGVISAAEGIRRACDREGDVITDKIEAKRLSRKKRIEWLLAYLGVCGVIGGIFQVYSTGSLLSFPVGFVIGILFGVWIPISLVVCIFFLAMCSG